MSRLVIGFIGPIGCGKTTAAKALIGYLGFERVRFAGPFKSMMKALGCTDEQVDGALKETPADLLCGQTPRWAMQSLGTEWGRNLIGPDLWIRAWQAAVDRVQAGQPVVADDVRFPNEVEAIRKRGGLVIRVVRPGVGVRVEHESESLECFPDMTLSNDGDQAAFEQLVIDRVMALGR